MNTAKMKAAALAATPGEWCPDDHHGVIADAGLNANFYIASCSGPEHRANKQFIAAANPAAVLELIAALEAAEQRNAELEESHAQVIQARDFYKRTNEVVMKRVAELAAPGVHHISELEKVLAWIEKLPVPTQGATTNYSRLKSVVDSCREAVPVADEIVGWVREDDGDARDPLFLCGSVHPENGRAYNSTYYPVKRAAMLDAPPAPVVPTFDEWLEIRGNKPLGWVKDAMRESYDACRAAMLAAPGKHPLSVDVLAGALRNAPLAPADNQGRQRAPVAAGWIACSERMPDDGVSVLAYCKCGDNFSGIYTMRAPVIRSKNSRKDDSVVHHERVTHWMPLPAAPGKEG
ncbi:DUF551 domain-containing protein [Cronobacter sakazakii]|uniref:DUF551 domain-containing protein n=1 Tax=Cronobacter sakazakii TaxID=28141 RepID=UPI003C12FB26